MHRFSASRGGHAPGHLREAFWTCMDNGWEALLDSETISFFDRHFQREWDQWPLAKRRRWLLGQLHNCTDVMPGNGCEELDLPMGSTYARGVRKLLSEPDYSCAAP